MGGLGEAAPGAGGAGFGIDHDPGGLDEPTPQGRGQSESDAGRITAGVADDPGFPDFIPEKLGQAVDRLLMQRGIERVTAVPGFVGFRIVQPEIRTEIDERLARRVAGGGGFLGQPVGQGGEDQIAPGQHGLCRIAGEVAELPQGGIDRREGFPFKRNRPHCRDLDPGMGEEKTYELDAGITGRAEDTGLDHHATVLSV